MLPLLLLASTLNLLALLLPVARGIGKEEEEEEVEAVVPGLESTEEEEEEE